MTHIWVPRQRIIEPNRELILPSAMVGYFKFEAIKPDGRKRLLADWFPNLIVDAGLNVIGTSGSWLNQCRVGTGNAAPSTSDTNLQSPLAATTSIQSGETGNSGSPDYYSWSRIRYRFAAGVAAGNLTEVGIGSTTVLFSRALILDGDGNPTTLTVLSDETLDVTYEIRHYPPTGDINGSINISGSGNHDYVLRGANIDSASTWLAGATLTGSAAAMVGGGYTASNSVIAYNGSIGANTDQPSGSSSAVSPSNLAYGDGNLYRDFQATFGLTEGNLAGGISALQFSFGSRSTSIGPRSCGQMQMSFDPPIPKTNTQSLNLVFRHTWGRRTI